MHLMIQIKHTMFNVGESAELYFSLWSTNQKRFISEEFMLRLTATGVCDDSKAVRHRQSLPLPLPLPPSPICDIPGTDLHSFVVVVYVLQPQKCVFSDIRASDLINANGLWLCCRVYRLGVVDASKKAKAGVVRFCFSAPPLNTGTHLPTILICGGDMI